jgi:hypothetical protein
MAISEKSVFASAQFTENELLLLTLSIQEVADRDGMTVTIRLNGCVSEHLIDVLRWANSHVLLTESSGVNIHVGMLLHHIALVNDEMEKLHHVGGDGMVILRAARREGSSGASSYEHQPRRCPPA